MALRFYWSNRSGLGGGSAPMFGKRGIDVIPADFVTNFVIADLSHVSGGLSALLLYLRSQVDMTATYSLSNNVTQHSDMLSETIFHEQGHASHYNKVGNTWWENFVNSEISEMIAGPSPYGTGLTSNSPIIALGESWAYHIGHFATDWKYGQTGPVGEQGIIYDNGLLNDHGSFVFIALNAHFNLLEDFSPLRTNDQFYWIPQGLYYDLMDNRNDNNAAPTRVPVSDNVNGYTNQQFFNALDADINTMQEFEVRLLNENGNNQALGVTTIFTFYGF